MNERNLLAGGGDSGGGDWVGGRRVGEFFAGAGGDGGDFGVGEMLERRHVVVVGVGEFAHGGGATEDEPEERLRIFGGNPSAAADVGLEERDAAAVGHVAGGAVLLEKGFTVEDGGGGRRGSFGNGRRSG